MAFSNFDLWPKSVVNGMCPFDGSPPTTGEGGVNYIQPLSELTLAQKVGFIWKVKKWRINATINADVAWESNSVDPPESGTTSVTRTLDRVFTSIDFTNEDIQFIQQIGCEFSGWAYAIDENTGGLMIVAVYENGLGLDLNSVEYGDNGEIAAISNNDLGILVGEIDATFEFFDTEITSTLYASVGNTNSQFPELDPEQAVVSVTITGGNVEITVEEAWDYA